MPPRLRNRFVRRYCTSLLVCLLVGTWIFCHSFHFPEQCPGALVIVWLSHAGLPRNRTSVCCSLRKTNPGQSGRQKFLARTGGRCVGSVSSKYHLSWYTISVKRFIKIRSLTVVFNLIFFFSLLGVLAMEALHRQVLPFLLRRMKEDVLQDLPPKIIQDYYCNLSPLQVCVARAQLFCHH